MQKKLPSSKEKLLEALSHQLTYRPIEEIKVSELINEAKISRSTFYRLFETKEIFFDWVLHYYLEGLSTTTKSNSENSQEFYYNYLTYIDQNSIYFKVFNNSNMWPQFNSEMYRIGIDIYKDFIFSQTYDKKLSIFVSNYIVNAHIGVVMEWLRQEKMERPEQLSKLLVELTSSALTSQGIEMENMFENRIK
ncbi:hypothetical protein BG261_06575 [Floricoccus tropicus]|uniref:HTH tetR-type domain-containing protein n=1 Tax=Floricoccus tropicus TaxID=1859473 RepID=A0A1E8GK49_9LACT|nr:TetR/AcrR family transcriptional regulator [Floricoccus tropicus]OFI48557.1 hypothetical protein BG261_06575 [Floricoccus tropicus]